VNQTATTRWRSIVAWTIGITLVVEAITIYLRFRAGINAVEFNDAAPLLLKIHHMFWCIPVLAAVPFVWRFPKTSGALLGIGCGLVLSDLIHHFILLPLTVGNIGWHWP
jgi:hypothetical protein